MVQRERISEIDLAKAIAIILVVLGHITLRSMPEGNEWYAIFRDMIYSFHMPLFMFLSGFLSFYTYREIASVHEYTVYAKNKFFRLMPAFFLFAVVIWVGKYVSSRYIYVDNVNNDLLSSVINFLIAPSNSVASNLWYVYVLFIYLLITPVWFYLGRIVGLRNKRILVAAVLSGLVFHFFPTGESTQYFAMNLVREYMFMFSLGMLSSVYWHEITSLAGKYKYLFTALFIGSFALNFTEVPFSYAKTVIGLCSVPAVIVLTQTRFIRNSRFLLLVSKCTFAIYLMNTIFIGIVKGIILKYYSWDGGNFILAAPLLFAAGLLGPIYIKTRIFPHYGAIHRITN